MQGEFTWAKVYPGLGMTRLCHYRWHKPLNGKSNFKHTTANDCFFPDRRLHDGAITEPQCYVHWPHLSQGLFLGKWIRPQLQGVRMGKSNRKKGKGTIHDIMQGYWCAWNQNVLSHRVRTTVDGNQFFYYFFYFKVAEKVRENCLLRIPTLP